MAARRFRSQAAYSPAASMAPGRPLHLPTEGGAAFRQEGLLIFVHYAEF